MNENENENESKDGAKYNATLGQPDAVRSWEYINHNFLVKVTHLTNTGRTLEMRKRFLPHDPFPEGGNMWTLSVRIALQYRPLASILEKEDKATRKEVLSTFLHDLPLPGQNVGAKWHNVCDSSGVEADFIELIYVYGTNGDIDKYINRGPADNIDDMLEDAHSLFAWLEARA